MSRADSMATIDAIIAQGSLVQSGEDLVKERDANDITVPNTVPGVGTGSPVTDLLTQTQTLTAGEKRASDVERQQRLDATTQEKTRRQQLLDEALHQRQEQQRQVAEASAFTKSAAATVSAASNIVKGTNVRLEKLPMVGSLALPIIVLFVLFFMLVQVNGHTRLMWLWLTIIGRAEMTPGSGNRGANGDFGTNVPNAPAGTATDTGGGGAVIQPSPTQLPISIVQPAGQPIGGGGGIPIAAGLPTQWWLPINQQSSTGTFAEEIS
jgi:hypothetical protein